MAIIAEYHTKTGIQAFVVTRDDYGNGRVGYRYYGKHGAGCGTLESIAQAIKLTMSSRRGIHLVAGHDITA